MTLVQYKARDTAKFHNAEELANFFKKNTSKFGALIHGDRFDLNLLDLIVSYI